MTEQLQEQWAALEGVGPNAMALKGEAFADALKAGIEDIAQEHGGQDLQAGRTR